MSNSIIRHLLRVSISAALLAALAIPLKPAQGQASPFGLYPPIILALDGFAPFATCAEDPRCKDIVTEALERSIERFLPAVASSLAGPTAELVFTYLSIRRTSEYLGPALAEKWGLADETVCSATQYLRSPASCIIVTIPWDGVLQGGSLENYIISAKQILDRIVNDTSDRPVAVIAHSWGSVVAYDALVDLRNDHRIGDGDIDVLLTLGDLQNLGERGAI